MDDSLRNAVATYQRLKSDKSTRLAHWQELADYMAPHMAAISADFTMGSRPFATLYDGTGQLAFQRFADGLFSHLSPTQLLLTAPAGSKLEKDRVYTNFLADRTEALQLAMRQGNAETELYAAYQGLGMGNCCIAVRKDPKRAFSLSTRDLKEYCFAENEDHVVDTVYSERNLTAYEAARKWGSEKLSADMQKALSEANDSAYSNAKPYLNIQRPNEEWDPSPLKVNGFPYSDIWLDLSDDDKVLSKKGMRRLRYIVARFWRPTGLPWGMGPCDTACSWVKALDKMMEVTLKYAARAWNPPSIWPDEAAFWPMSVQPGAMIVGRMGAMDRGRPQFMEVGSDHRLQEWLFGYCSNLVNESFMSQIFQVLRDTKQRTAREVATVLQKDYDMAIPVLARLRSELFGPLIRICLELQTEFELGTYGWQYGGKPLPEYEYDLELISPLGLAVRYAELQKLDNLMVLNSQLATIDPAVWDNYSLDDISRGIGENMGIPRTWFTTDSALRDIRSARARMMAQQQAVQQARLMSQTTKDLSKGIESNSPLERMVA